MVGCWWLVGPWCKVVVAVVVLGRRFVEHVLLIRATEGFRKRRVWTEVVLVDAPCRRCGFSPGHSRNLARHGLARVACHFRTCGFSPGEIANSEGGWSGFRS